MSKLDVVEELAGFFGWDLAGVVSATGGWTAHWYTKPGRDILYVRFSSRGAVTRASYGRFDTKTDFQKFTGTDKAGQVLRFMGVSPGQAG